MAMGVTMKAIQENQNFYDTVVSLASNKLYLLIFFNLLIVLLINFGNLLIWIFFSEIRTIESNVLLLLFTTFSVVHSRQVVEKALPLPASGSDSAQLLRRLQIHLTIHSVLLLGAALAGVQEERLPDQ